MYIEINKSKKFNCNYKKLHLFYLNNIKWKQKSLLMTHKITIFNKNNQNYSTTNASNCLYLFLRKKGHSFL